MKQSESQCKEASRKGETSLFKRETGKAWTETEGEAKAWWLGFPGGAVVKNPPANAGDTGSSPGPGRSHMPWSN